MDNETKKVRVKRNKAPKRRIPARVKFGSWGGEDISWICLEKTGGAALLLAENALDCQYFHVNNDGTNWAGCSLRRWLNGEFLHGAFTETEQGKILNMPVHTPDCADRYIEEAMRLGTTISGNEEADASGLTVPGGPDTEDSVFLLSLQEARHYHALGDELPDAVRTPDEETCGCSAAKAAKAIADKQAAADAQAEELKALGSAVRPAGEDNTESRGVLYNVLGCAPTKYAHKQGVPNYTTGMCWWWLRSPGSWRSHSRAIVYADGTIFRGGHPARWSGGAVRPAMWVDLSVLPVRAEKPAGETEE